jgi:glycosyltransferase involved in cell wall biosynthesis
VVAPEMPGGGGEGPVELCIVRPTLGQGGADRVTLTLLRALDRHRFRPSLALMRAEGVLLSEVPTDVVVHDLESRSLWTAWLPLARLLRHRLPRVLLSTSSGANLIACLAHLFAGRGIRLVLSERNVLYRDQGRVKRWLQRLLKRRLYPRADCVAAVSRGVADDLEKRLGLPPERIRVVYNPVVTSELDELAAIEPDPRWFEDDVPVVLGVGRLVPAKGFDHLLKVFAELESRRQARLVLLGEGAERPALERLAGQLGIAENVWFAGYDPNPFRYMSRCAVFVLSSRFEGLPGALIQAMACGAAAVATDCPAGPSEILSHGVDGFLVPVDDRPAMVASVARLLDDEKLRSRIGREARRSARRFSLEATMGGYVEALIGAAGRDLTSL